MSKQVLSHAILWGILSKFCHIIHAYVYSTIFEWRISKILQNYSLIYLLMRHLCLLIRWYTVCCKHLVQASATNRNYLNNICFVFKYCSCMLMLVHRWRRHLPPGAAPLSLQLWASSWLCSTLKERKLLLHKQHECILACGITCFPVRRLWTLCELCQIHCDRQHERSLDLLPGLQKNQVEYLNFWRRILHCLSVVFIGYLHWEK